MRTLFESRLDNVVDAGSIGIGERVDVRTKMGIHVTTGEVIASNPFGLVLREGGFFDRELYLFAPLEETPKIQVMNGLQSDIDGRVAEKLRNMGEAERLVFEVEKLDSKDDNVDDKKDDKKDSEDDIEDDADADKVDTKKDEKQPLAKPESSVDVEKLPEDIKKSVVSTTQMNADQLNSVLSEIGDSTVKALKSANVKDTEIYSTAAKVQNAVHRILTGAPPAPPAPPKKKKK